MMESYNSIMFLYMITTIIITVLGLIGIIVAAMITMKGADKISKNIAAGMADKVEKNIKRDIDSGKFFY